MDKEKDIERKGYTGNTIYSQLSENVYHINQRNIPVSIDDLGFITTQKIRKRLILCKNKLNGLATLVVDSKTKYKIDLEDLQDISYLSNEINDEIGLPHTKSIVIRTSKRNNELSDPMYLLSDVNDISKENWLNFQYFLNTLGKEVFLMIHDDNYELQKKCIHGRFLIRKDTCELAFKTGSAHARQIGDPELIHPTIIINSNNLDDIFRVQPKTISNLLNTNSVEVKFRRVKIRMRNFRNDSSAIKLYKRMVKNRMFLHEAYEKISKIYGNSKVMEFRIYPTENIGLCKNFHVLDIDG